MNVFETSRGVHLIDSAIRFFNNERRIDWEQRRYEIAKDIFVNDMVRATNINYFPGENAAKDAVECADALIAKLKEKKQ